MSIASTAIEKSNKDNLSTDSTRKNRDSILEVSNFLNQFQSHFLPALPESPPSQRPNTADNNESESVSKFPLGDISPQDLQNALEFRTLLEKFGILEEELYVVDQYGSDDERIAPLTRRYVENKTEELDNLREQVNSVVDRTKLLLKLLQRFEVWTCKIVAQDQLVTSTRLLPEAARVKTNQCCFSPLVNIPSSKYFEELHPPIELGEDEKENDKNNSTTTSTSAFYRRNKYIQCCTLPVPPNKNTWEAYARLAIMASFLDNSEIPVGGDDEGGGNEIISVSTSDDKREFLTQSLKSPACIHDFNRYKKGQNPSQKHDYTFSSSDLIPIWIRAQRNTQSLRQLILLFEVQQLHNTITNDEDNGNDNVNGNEKSVDSNILLKKSTTVPFSVSTTVLGTGVRGVGKRLVVNITDTEDGDDSQQQQQQQQQHQQQETVTNTTTIEENNNLPLKAILRGNPVSIRSQVIEVSNFVDQLVEWAVVNQSIFTYQRIKKQILTVPLQKKMQKQQHTKKRRQREIDYFRANATKRIRNDGGSGEEDSLFELRQACQSYLLRWFARRNRNASTILFSNRSEPFFLLDIGCMMNKKVLKQAAVLREGNIPSDIKEYMHKLPASGDYHFEDRTFARIDRRLFIKGRYDGSTTAVPCRSHVSTLLEGLSKKCPDNQNSHKKLVAAAKEDLKKLFSTFSPSTADYDDNHDDDDNDEDAIYENALKLISPSKGCTQESLIDLLKSTPAPWAEKCSKCDKVGNTELRTCLNCEQVFHEECSGTGSGSGRSTSLKNLIQSFPPLNNLFKMKRPENLDPPNFIDLEWVEKTLTIDRKIEDDGKVSKLGISFDNVDKCCKLFDTLQSNDACSIAKQMNEEDIDSKGRKFKIPAKIGRKGCLLTMVKKDYCADQAGLKKGDIIIDIKFEELVNAEDGDKYGKSKRFDMSTLTHDGFVTLFKVQSLRMKMTIIRTPTDIIKMAKNWHAAMMKLNKNILDVFRGLNVSSLWYCEACTQSKVYDESETVFLEAEYCRAVIRRIGMEAYAQPFWEGNQKDESGFFCLRRLDSIMTHIMRVQSKDDSYDFFPEAFLTPPIGNSIRQRLGWATKKLEKRPMELFCEAIKTLISSSFPGVSQLITKRNALIRHFLVAFSSWCIGTIVKSSFFKAMLGPPDTFRYSRAPWFGTSCSVCCSQPVENQNAGTCKNQLCLNRAARSERHIDDISDKEIIRIGNNMSEYSKHASLVGTLFLVLPSDSLVEYVSKIVRIEHENRPIEFIVASYLPPDYHDTVLNGRQKADYDQFDEGDGIYHLLPVVNARQQLYLLERCKMRDQKKTNGGSNFSWSSLDVLNLDGVARYSPAALRKKMRDSNRIRLAIDSAIVQGQEICKSSIESLNLSSHSHTTSEDRVSLPQFFYTQSTDCNFEVQNKLIGTLLKGKAATELVRGLLCTNSTDDQITPVDTEVNSSDWKIIQGEGDSHELEFGLSRLHQGLIPVNGIKATSQILLPSSVLEGKSALYYSDFLFQDEEGKRNMTKTIFPSNLLPYQGHRSKLLERSFTLSQSGSSGTNNVFGWGFEILKWKNEHILRVGRVKRGSPACSIGLKPHDIITAVNGRKFTWFKNLSDFVTSILVPSVKIRMDENQNRIDIISMLLSTIKDSNIKLSPVVLSIHRPQSMDNRANQSQMTVSRPQTVQRPLRQYDLPQTNLERNHSTGRRRSSLTEPLRAKANVQSPRSIVAPPVVRNPLPQVNANTNANANANAYAYSNQGRVAQHTSTTNTPTNGRDSAPINGRKEAASKLIRILKDSYHDRPLFQQSDLYRAARNGTILTVLEVSVFFECLLNGNWKLGMRLLMPRYDVQTVVEQVKRLVCWTRGMIVASTIPIVRKEFHQHLLQLDYDRMNDQDAPETGKFILTEVTNGVTYRYRFPIKPLPIDRNIEVQYQHHAAYQHLPIHQQQHQQHPHSHPHPHQHPPVQQEHQHPPVQQQHQQEHQHPPVQQYPQTQYQYPTPHHQMWQSRRNEYHEYNSQHQQEVNYNDTSPNSPQDYRANCPSQEANGYGNQNHRSPPQPNHVRGNDLNNSDAVVNLLDSEEENVSAVGEIVEDTDEPSLAIYDEGIYNRGTYGNHGKSDRESTSNLTAYPSERIRGGGESEDSVTDQSTDICLYDIPVQDWNQKPVFTVVQTASEGSLSNESNEATLVGFAKGPQQWNSKDDSIPDKVEVEAYYLSSIGYFDAMKINEFYSDDVWVVDTNSDSEEAKVIVKLRSQNTSHVAGDSVYEKQQDLMSDVHVTDDRLEEKEGQRDSMKKAALTLASSFTDLQLLGKMPDGRDVIWISNDPMAIYLDGTLVQGVEQNLRSQYLSSLKQAQGIPLEIRPDVVPLRKLPSKCYPCVWGCSVIGTGRKRRQCLTFSSEKELYRHYYSHHFCQSDSMVTLGEAGKFIRIQDGKHLVEFTSAISSAIVARFPLLEQQAQKGNCCKESTSEVEFFTSPTGETLNFPVNKKMFGFCLSLLSNSDRADAKHINNLVQLWFHVAKLFQCDTTGYCRLDWKDFHPATLLANNFQNDPLCLEFEGVAQNCSCEKKSVGQKKHLSICYRGYHNCSLCSLPFERYLLCSTPKKETISKKEGSEITLRRSLGCGLMSDAALTGKQSCFEENNIPGRLGEAKMLLLQVAALIPESVKLTTETPQRHKLIDLLNSSRVFDSDLNYITWKTFLAECTCTQMLAQALVTLLASIQRCKLPDWWSRENSGWSTSYVIMTESSLSTLYLHIYMLDAALSDILSRSLLGKIRQQHKSDETNIIQQRKLWTLAMSKGFEPFKGDNHGECYHCNDGGTLLCCELCPRVQHHECCVPQLSPDVTLEHWICDSCVNDIENYEDEDEDFEQYLGEDEDEESS